MWNVKIKVIPVIIGDNNNNNNRDNNNNNNNKGDNNNNVMKKRNRDNSKIQRPYNRNTTHVECKNKGDTSNNRGDWDYFRVIQKISEQNTRKS